MDPNNQNEIVIVPGADVVGVDGDKIGSVKEVFPDYIVVEKGWFFPSDHYIPASAISDANENTVFLNVSKDEALKKGWENPPTGTSTTTAGMAPEAAAGTGAMATDTGAVYNDTTARDYVTEDRVGAGTGNNQFAPIDNAANNTTAGDAGAPGSWATEDQTAATGTHTEPFTHTADETAHLDENETIRVPLAEEELTATKRPVETGGVRVTKDVEETEQTLEVPVRQEHVDVERRVVDRDVAPGDTAFEEGTIEVPVRSEEVDVQKRARVGEELDITKNVTEETRHVSDTVRKERANVENVTGTETVTGTDNLNGTDTVNNVNNTYNTTDGNDESLIDKAKDKVEDVTHTRRR